MLSIGDEYTASTRSFAMAYKNEIEDGGKKMKTHD
jgi:hypothetical protein